MKSYTSHLSEAAQNHQKKEDAPDTISKSVACALSFNAAGNVVGSVNLEFNYFLTARFGHKSFQS
ncbi:hypothetical protein LDL77_02180 [Flagellimonas marinaquae]|uniref:Uncharacterized protein n=2 Tax=Flagellimonas TaxID=444459 RepID=A0ABS3G8Y6_9FLAO|nr:hypothetical protein [Allomuricauda aurea]MBO0355875.1 hypothetical protein [Allomuricauda aurea]UBZ14533.1 hypothetical protein LDL77_02180 [Allomuricauda aquimarina]